MIRSLLTVTFLACTSLSAHAEGDYIAPAGCISAADAAAAAQLWKNPVVRGFFKQEDPMRQHMAASESCWLIDFSRTSGSGGDVDFFTFVEESDMYQVWADSGLLEKEGVNRLGLYVALHELSHGRALSQ
jgi:hypothetical protein